MRPPYHADRAHLGQAQMSAVVSPRSRGARERARLLRHAMQRTAQNSLALGLLQALLLTGAGLG